MSHDILPLQIRGSCIEVLRYARRLSGRMFIEFAVGNLDYFGRHPNEIMKRISVLRHEGSALHIKSKMAFHDRLDQLIPVLMSELSMLERHEKARRTTEAIRNAKAQGSSSGRPLVMTPERQAIAARMLAQGKRGSEVLAVIRGLNGPNVSQSAYYLWQKTWLEQSFIGSVGQR